MKNPKYWEQYERVQRWYKRFENINSARPHSMALDNYQDEVYAFFMNCYHLKDWIKHDPEKNILADKAEKLFDEESNISLKICKDICNGHKHLVSYAPKVKYIGSERLAGFNNRQLISLKYEVLAGNKKYDAFKIALDCMNIWKRFLIQDPKFNRKFNSGSFNIV